MASSPHFFKIILQNSLKLKLPAKFVREYGKFLSNHVLLELPNGEKWRVGLTTVDGMVWLQNGWHQFAQRYSLEFGSFLVFRYNGSNATLHTMIFHTSGMEIDYSCKVPEEEDKDDDSVEILDSFPSPQLPKKRENTSFPSLQPCKKMRNAYPNIPKKEPDQSMRDQAKTSVRIKPEVPNVKVESGISPSRICAKLKDLHWTEESLHASYRDSIFMSTKPSFVMSMLPFQVQKCSLNLPSWFAKKHLLDSNFTYRDAVLETSSEGKKWPAKLYSTGSIAHPRVELCYGWRSFVKDNHLKEGDVCVFELMSTKNMASQPVLHITIFRPFQHPNCSNLLLLPPQDDSLRASLKAPESSSAEKRKTPFFEADSAFKSLRNGTLSIPVSFARKHLSPKTQIAKLEVEDKQWLVKILNSDGNYRFSAGWSAFGNENCLGDGDRCVFELMSKKKCAFKVTIKKGHI